MNIYLVRHAQKDTSDKTSKEEHFSRDITDVGRRQAEELGHYLKDKKITKIISSNMPRAISTAKIVAEILAVPIFDQSPDLREADPCLLPTQPNRQEIKIKCWQNWDYKPEHGESYNEGKLRFRRYFKDLINKTLDYENILIISHGRVLRLFLSDYLEGGKETIKSSYAHVAITHIKVKDKNNLEIFTYNDNSYLSEDLRV